MVIPVAVGTGDKLGKIHNLPISVGVSVGVSPRKVDGYKSIVILLHANQDET